MKNINWLQSVGKVIVFNLQGTKDDKATSVYNQTIATTIRAVNASKVFTEVFCDTVKIYGDCLIWELKNISISNTDKLILIDVDGYQISGEVIEVY